MRKTAVPTATGKIFTDPHFASLVEKRLEQAAQGQQALPLNDHRKAAVLIPLLQHDGEWHLLFIRRSVEVQDHKGQVAFPGGAIETWDENAIAAALRETWEEIGLPKESIRILGQMSGRNTITRYYISPIVGVIPWPSTILMQTSEVSRVFTIPLKWLAMPENHSIKEVIRPNGAREPVYYFKEYDGELLWGITAAMTLHLLQLITQ
ncbi:MAG TPA: CoA pyrophosphatase [Longilinea sp.]|nr:CoA pyrophosphatase [Longilinea sp.]